MRLHATAARRSLVAVLLSAIATVGPGGTSLAAITAPSIVVSATALAPGSALSVSGSGWGATEQQGGGCSGAETVVFRSVDMVVTLVYATTGLDVSQLARHAFKLDASARGSWNYTLTVPPNASPGPAIVRVSSTIRSAPGFSIETPITIR